MKIRKKKLNIFETAEFKKRKKINTIVHVLSLYHTTS